MFRISSDLYPSSQQETTDSLPWHRDFLQSHCESLNRLSQSGNRAGYQQLLEQLQKKLKPNTPFETCKILCLNFSLIISLMPSATRERTSIQVFIDMIYKNLHIVLFDHFVGARDENPYLDVLNVVTLEIWPNLLLTDYERLERTLSSIENELPPHIKISPRIVNALDFIKKQLSSFYFPLIQNKLYEVKEVSEVIDIQKKIYLVSNRLRSGEPLVERSIDSCKKFAHEKLASLTMRQEPSLPSFQSLLSSDPVMWTAQDIFKDLFPPDANWL